MNPRYTLGLDFGTESARAILVDVHTGRIAGQGVAAYPHGVIDRALPNSGKPLPPGYALQHPQDWLTTSTSAVRAALSESKLIASDVIGIGVDFTSCTMLPTHADGTPLCLTPRFANDPMAWPKLWKHHGATAETDRLSAIAKKRNEPWLDRYGGTIGLEWLFPKILETLNTSPDIYQATEIFLEAGDWLVWQLTTGPYPHCDPNQLVRSTCQAGYKACWNAHTGYPSTDFLQEAHPRLACVVADKLPGKLQPPGTRAGLLCESAAHLLGLRPGTPISTAIIDAHAGVIGAGAAEPGTMVLVLGTSACHMVNSLEENRVPGVAGIVQDGILPGYFGYETGQAAVGDALDFVARSFSKSHEELTTAATQLPPGSGNLLALDWLNGCRTPLMDARLTGAILGLTLATQPHQIYRAFIEATAFGLKRICDSLQEAGVPIREFIAAGGLPNKNSLLMQIYTDVLGHPVTLAASDQSVALGAAILAALAAGPAITGHKSVQQAIHAMVPSTNRKTYAPNPVNHRRYTALNSIYRNLSERDGHLAQAMRELCGG